MKKAVVIEDQMILRELIVKLLDAFPFIELSGQTGDGNEGYQLCLRHNPDFVILDMMLPTLNGLDILKRLQADKMKPNVLVFSAYFNSGMVNKALRLGVKGFVEKNVGLEELEKAINKVSNGDTYFGPHVLEVLRDLMMNPETDDSLDSLTPREREIIKLIAESCTTKEIAAKLYISPKTVETHRTHIMRKLNLHDVAGITRYAIANGLTELPQTPD